MANANLSVTIQDSLGVTGTQNIWLVLDGTQTVDDVGAEFNTYLPLLDAVTDGKILGARLIWDVDLPGGLKAAPAPDTTITRGLDQGWTQAGNPNRHPSTIIPAVAEALIDNTTGKFILTNAAYLAWKNHLLGLVGPAITFVSDDLRNITGVFRVVESKRKHNKRTKQLSYQKQ